VDEAAGFAGFRCRLAIMERFARRARHRVVNASPRAQDVAWHGGGYDAGTPLLWK